MPPTEPILNTPEREQYNGLARSYSDHLATMDDINKRQINLDNQQRMLNDERDRIQSVIDQMFSEMMALHPKLSAEAPPPQGNLASRTAPAAPAGPRPTAPPATQMPQTGSTPGR